CEAQPAVHVQQHIRVFALREHTGRRGRLTQGHKSSIQFRIFRRPQRSGAECSSTISASSCKNRSYFGSAAFQPSLSNFFITASRPLCFESAARSAYSKGSLLWS